MKLNSLRFLFIHGIAREKFNGHDSIKRVRCQVGSYDQIVFLRLHVRRKQDAAGRLVVLVVIAIAIAAAAGGGGTGHVYFSWRCNAMRFKVNLDYYCSIQSVMATR